jgi:hypothetical protein
MSYGFRIQGHLITISTIPDEKGNEHGLIDLYIPKELRFSSEKRDILFQYIIAEFIKEYGLHANTMRMLEGVNALCGLLDEQGWFVDTTKMS